MPRPPLASDNRTPTVIPVLALSLIWLAAPPSERAPVDAPPRMDFVLPEPGTYELHRIMRAPDGAVLTVDGGLAKLSQFTRGRITLLGFIYTSCTNPQGCPLAYRVFDRLKEEIRGTAALKDQVQLVTLSFDPARDSPSVMKRYAGSQLEDEEGLRWFFLTTPSVRDLLPLVEGFGQDVQYSVDGSSGRPVRQLSHVLKVFLIDRAGDVREIYTSTFLHPRAIMGDIKTLLME
jgi:protein SCO1